LGIAREAYRLGHRRMSHADMDTGRWSRLRTGPNLPSYHPTPEQPEIFVTASAPALALSATRRPTLTLPAVAAGAAALAATTQLVAMSFLVIAHFSGGMRFGDGSHSAIVDALHTVTIVLLAPLPFALHRALAPVDRRRSAAAVALAVDAIVFGAVLHALFALGVVTFEAASPLVLVGYGAFAGWLWMVGSLGSTGGLLPEGRRMAVIGATVVGFPIWLVWVARRLDATAS
jgi:hypothetical protein